MKRTVLINILKYGLGIGLLAYVLASNWHSDDPSVPGLSELIRNPVRIGPLVAALTLCSMGIALTFVRWYLLVRAQSLPFTLHNAMRLGLVGYYFNTFLPGSVGGDLLKAYFIAKEQSRRTVAVATVMADRAIGLWGLIWFVGLLGFYLTLVGSSALEINDYLPRIVRIAWWVIGISLLGWAVLGFLPARQANHVTQTLMRVPKVGYHLAELWLAVQLYLKRPKAVLVGLAISLISHSCFILTFHFATRVFTPPDASVGTLVEHFLVVPVGFIAQAFFPTPGGVGGAEFAFGWLYGTVLLKPEVNGVFGMVTMRAIMWILGFTGFLLYLRMKSRLPHVPEEPELEVPIDPQVDGSTSPIRGGSLTSAEPRTTK